MLITDITARVIAANYSEAASNQIPYLGEGFFPRRKKASIDLAWIIEQTGLPISLMPSAFDAKATYRDRPEFQMVTTEMPFFREGFKIKERDRQELLRVRDMNDPYFSEIMDRIFDDARNLIAGANVVAERMRMQLLFPVGGDLGINIAANGVNYSYNYDPNGTWKATNYIALTGNDLWSASTTANPFNSLQAAKRVVEQQTGREVTVAVMNGTTFAALATTDAVKNRILNVANGPLVFVSDAEVRRALRDTLGLDIVVYDKHFLNEARVDTQFVPDGYVALVPNGAVGGLWYGTTPEEADLLGSDAAEVEVVDTGIAITTERQVHPVNVNIYASEILLPSFEGMNTVAVLKVL